MRAWRAARRVFTACPVSRRRPGAERWVTTSAWGLPAGRAAFQRRRAARPAAYRRRARWRPTSESGPRRTNSSGVGGLSRLAAVGTRPAAAAASSATLAQGLPPAAPPVVRAWAAETSSHRER